MAESLTDFIAKLLRPIFLPAARLMAGPKEGHTWQYEAAIVGTALVLVALFTSPAWNILWMDPGALRHFSIIWLSAAAVFGTFLHAQVATYMAEDMGSASGEPLTECYPKLGEYWVYKEILWFLVFLISGAYPAIAGNVIFLLFPAWRKVYKEERQKIALGTPLL